MHRYRSHTCGALRAADIGADTRLSGWVHRVRDHGGVLFIDLRDHYGLTQVVADPDSPAFKAAEKVRSEWVIKVDGRVRQRPEGTINPELPTGEVEVYAAEIEVLSEAKELPVPVFGEPDYPEDMRLTYRFLDLRRETLHAVIMKRLAITRSIRSRMHDAGFNEFPTPILTASSPEGARDFLVPSRIHAGKFYALPQAPQQYKQLLMMAGFDRYFQIAPCFRDEDPRADRLPGEFYQLDVEMSFVEQEDVFSTMEPIITGVFEDFAPLSGASAAHTAPAPSSAASAAHTAPAPSSAASAAHTAPAPSSAASAAHTAPAPSSAASAAHTAPAPSSGASAAHTAPAPSSGASAAHTAPAPSSAASAAHTAPAAGKRMTVTTGWPRIPYDEAIAKYGTDKPDLRNPIEMQDVTEHFRGSGFKVFAQMIERDPKVRVWAIPAKGGGSRAFCDRMNGWAQKQGQPGLGYIFWRPRSESLSNIDMMLLARGLEAAQLSGDTEAVERLTKKYLDDIEGSGPIAKNIGPELTAGIAAQLDLKAGDACFFTAGDPSKFYKFAGQARDEIGRELKLIEEDRFALCWIVDFPFFEWNEDEKKIDFSHNPFSMPQGGLAALEAAEKEGTEALLRLKAHQYDMVCNGYEIASGGIRNHRPDAMVKAFGIAGRDAREVEERFGALYRAFQYGAPPHGGMAAGIERIVMLLTGCKTVRDVALFPMNQQASDLLMGAPAEASNKQLRELHIRVTAETKG